MQCLVILVFNSQGETTLEVALCNSSEGHYKYFVREQSVRSDAYGRNDNQPSDPLLPCFYLLCSVSTFNSNCSAQLKAIYKSKD